MSGAFTTYGRKLLIEGLFVSPAPLGDVYIAMTFVIPGTTDDATRLVEPVGNNYARKAYGFANGWQAGSAGEVFNTAPVTFGMPSADWGTIRGWAICSAAAAGKVIAAGPLRQPTPVRVGMLPEIATRGIRAALR